MYSLLQCAETPWRLKPSLDSLETSLKSITYRTLVVVSLLLVVSNGFAMKPYKDYIKTPASYQCKYDTVNFVTKDNV